MSAARSGTGRKPPRPGPSRKRGPPSGTGPPGSRIRESSRSPALEPPEDRGPREWRLALVLATLAWALFFFPQLFLGQTFTLGDAVAFRPFHEYSRARWHDQHVRTYWNPYTFMGVEAVASLADSRPQYLPDPLLEITERLSQPALSPQLWLLIAHLAGTIALMMLARRLWHAPGLAALCGGLVWLLAVPLLVPLFFGHDAQFVTAALIPVALLCAHHVVHDRPDLRAWFAALALALCVAVQILDGHPQIAVYSAMLVTAFAIHQAWAERAPRRFALFVVAMALGVEMATAVWWPALLFSAQSFRGGGGTAGLSLLEVAKFSLGWRDLVSLVWPHALGYGGSTYWGAMMGPDYSPYLGAVAITLALLGRGAWSARPSTSAFLWGALAFAVLFSLGTTLGPVFGVARATIPFWSKFRVAFYILTPAAVILALLVARGASRIDTPRPVVTPRFERRALIAAGVLAVLALALALEPVRNAVAAWAYSLRPKVGVEGARHAVHNADLDLLLRAGLVALVILVLALQRRGRLGAASATGCLAILIAADLGTLVVPAAWRSTGTLHDVAAPPPTPLARVVARDSLFRGQVGVADLMDGRYYEAYTNHWVAWRARCLTGLPGAPPDRWRRAMRHDLVHRAPAVRAWGVGYVDLPASVRVDTSSLRPVALPAQPNAALEPDTIRVYALRGALGRAYAPRFVIAVADEEAAARAMALPGFEPALGAVVTDQAAAGDYPGSERCAIRWVRDDPEELILDTEAPDRAFVVVADSYFPGWTATLDDRPTHLYETNLLVRGVVVPAGRHRIAMHYETQGMRAATLATRLGLLVWSVALLACITLALLRGRPRSELSKSPSRS